MRVTDPWANQSDPTYPAHPTYPAPAHPAPAPGTPPMGYDPVTGQPLSDKSKIVAGLLQLVPGFFIGLGGLGRLYAGHTGLGVAQLVVTALSWTAFWCGFAFLFVPWVLTGFAWLWFVIDGIVLMAGRPVDAYGRPLRG